MQYKEKIKKLKSLGKFINGKYKEEIILILDKNYKSDKWSVVCSVIHWINVVSPYIDCRKVLKKNTKDYNWGNVYLYLCSVDIITKGINELYKIVNKDNKHLFKGENDIFKLAVDDNHHFQNIRAVFGAHPTNLDGNGEYIVASFPTPYNWNFDQIRGISRNWDYYTLLWSNKKSKDFLQKNFGFSFYDVDRYLDKYIYYLDIFFKEIKKMINLYYQKLSMKKINKICNINKQIDLLIIEDEKRYNGKYSYDLKRYKLLVNAKFTSKKNEKEYYLFRKKIISLRNRIYNAIQNPLRYKSLTFLTDIIDSNTIYFDDKTSYYYSKLLEYKNNMDMKDELIEYYRTKIYPFGVNIKRLKELYCLVKAFNYYSAPNVENRRFNE